MAISSDGQKPFPAVVIVLIVLLVCLFGGQIWIAHLLPGISGIARINSSVIILDIPVNLPVAVDLILVPGLFILVYTIVILIYHSQRSMPVWREAAQRLGAVFSGLFILLFCVACGGLISYLVQGHLPRDIRNGIESLGINADIHLPYPGYNAIHAHGNLIALVGFVIGIALCIGRIKRPLRIRKTIPLTREQRMTPYQRMMQERRNQAKGIPNNSLCRNQPLHTIKPEAVNYRPMG